MTDQLMLDLAWEYMQRVEITDTQYFFVRHTDMKHPHLHILYNRVRYDTTLVSDRNERLHNMRICKYLKQVYSLIFCAARSNLPRSILLKFYIKPQLPGVASIRRQSCILLKFYIKPQHWGETSVAKGVVSY